MTCKVHWLSVGCCNNLVGKITKFHLLRAINKNNLFHSEIIDEKKIFIEKLKDGKTIYHPLAHIDNLDDNDEFMIFNETKNPISVVLLGNDGNIALSEIKF